MGKTPRRRAASYQGTTGGTPSQGRQPVAFKGQVRKVLRHPLIIATSGLVGAGLLSGYALMQPTTYEAKSTVIVYALPVDPMSTANSTLKVDIDTESAVAHSREVAELAAQKLSMTEDDDVKKILNATKSAGHSQTSILDITATAKSPEDAASRANAMADAYLEVRQKNASADIESATEDIKNKISDLSKDSNANQTTISELRQDLARVQVASTNAGRVITHATEPQSPSGLGLPIYAGVGLAAGLIVGIPLAYFVDSTRRKLSYPDRAEEIMGAPVSIIDPAHVVEDIRLTLRRAGITDISQPTENYRGLVVYSPTQKVAAAVTQMLQLIAGDRNNVVFTNKLEDIHTGSPVTICTLASYAELPDVLGAADALGYGLLAFTAETDVDEVMRIHREAAASSATFIPTFITTQTTSERKSS